MGAPRAASPATSSTTRALVINRSNAVTLAGVISGTGSLTQAGTGTPTLTGTNTYTGGTTISAGTLQLGNGGTTGSIAGNIVDNSALVINRSNAVTLAGVISGTGSLTQAGTGTTTLTGANTYTGGTTISAGTLQVGADANLGNAAGAITFAGGTLQYLASFASNRTITLNAGGGTIDTNGNIATLSGIIGGPGGLTKSGAGTLVLSNANTYSGGTTLAAGTLRLENNRALGTGALTTTGSVVDYASGIAIANPIVVNSNATQIQVTAGSAIQAGVISELNGPRPIEKIGAGTLVLTAANTYAGPTTITGGTLQIGNGSSSGSLAGNVINNATFVINRSDNYVFDNVISGTGAFQQNGNGATMLTAVNSYVGSTTVNSGALIVNGSIASSNLTTVNAGAALGGSGTVGSTTIATGGTFAPGPTRSAGHDGGFRQSRVPVRGTLRRAGQSYDGLDHQCERHSLACRHRAGQLLGGQLCRAQLHHFDGRRRPHRHVRWSHHTGLAGQLRHEPELYRQYRGAQSDSPTRSAAEPATDAARSARSADASCPAATDLHRQSAQRRQYDR